MSVSEEKYKEVLKLLERSQNQVASLSGLKMKLYHEDECWIWNMDGDNYIDSLACPITMYPNQLQGILMELVDIVTSDIGVGFLSTAKRKELINQLECMKNHV